MDNFRQKSVEELEKQKKSVEEKVGVPIIPRSGKELTPVRLKERFPARYSHFVEVLRALKNPEYRSEKVDQSVKNFKILSGLDEYLLRAENGEDKILIPRQFATMEKIVGFMERGNTAGHVTLPTGIGKTVIFSKLIEAVTKKTGARVLVVGPTKVILHQNRWKMGEFGEIEAGAYFGAEKDLSKAVTVTTYASLRIGVKNKDINPKDFDMLILDEAHRALGEETISAIDAFPEDVIKIGFTATPEFHEEKSLADILPVTIDKMSVREGIEGRLLSGLKVFLVPTKKDFSKIERKGREYKEDALEKIVNTPDRNKLVVNVYKDNPRLNGKLAIVYCAGRQHAKDVKQNFLDAGIKAGYIDGTTKDVEREKLFTEFKHGNIKVLCNAQVLIEGFDEPEAEVCINAAPTLSKVMAEQRGGRVLRRSRRINDKVGLIIEIVDDFGTSANTPVLFSEIAGAAEILPEKEQKDKINREKGERNEREKVDVEVTTTLVDDPELIMQLTNRNMRQRFDKMFEYAPRKWTTSRQLAHELGERENGVRAFAETQIALNPDWSKRYLTSTDILTNHYNIELSDIIRRHFRPELVGTVTPLEYADTHAMPEARALEVLSAAGENAAVMPFEFEDAVYYPKEPLEQVIEGERENVRREDIGQAQTAEAAFWEDDELTDEEREEKYWSQFEPIQSAEEEEEETEHKKKIPFDEEIHTPDLKDQVVWTEGKKAEINSVLNTLDRRERIVLQRRFFEEKTLDEIGTEFRLNRERIRQIEGKALRKLRHPSRLQLIENLFITDAEAEKTVVSAEKAKEMEIVATTSLDIIRKKYIDFRKKIVDSLQGKDYIASWDKEYYESFTALENSLFEKDKKFIDSYLSETGSLGKETGTTPKLLYNLIIRSILLKVKHGFERSLSPDGKMVDVYDIYTIREEIRKIEHIDEQIEEIKNHTDAIYKKWVKELRKEKKEKEPRLQELNEYERKYVEHFLENK
ncbi:MAG TPA: sigma-70 family RNA polymerase sigma factor [Candidatus Paceibacterota bacterium]|nr:sigma-70 family RNA polymerase sigma factor [Candidatus Paceibacterota bacterium]